MNDAWQEVEVAGFCGFTGRVMRGAEYNRFRGGAEMHTLLTILRNLRDQDDGATMVEYGLMIALIALAAIAGVTLFGSSVQQLYQGIASEIVAAIH